MNPTSPPTDGLAEHYSPADALSDTKGTRGRSCELASPGVAPSCPARDDERLRASRRRRVVAGSAGTPADGPDFLIHELISGEHCQDSTYERNPDELIEEGKPTGLNLFPRRLGRFGRARKRGLELALFLGRLADEQLPESVEDTYTGRRRHRPDRAELKRRAKRLARCGDWLHFRHFFTRDLVQLAGGRFCQQDRLCGNCARRRGAKLLRRHVEHVQHVVSEHPELRGWHVVVTAQNQSDLAAMARHVFGSMQRWINSRSAYLRRPKWNYRTVLADVAGGLLSGETKRGKNSGDWHLHLHAIFLAEQRPDAEQLAAEWHRLTGDSFIVHVEPFHYVRDGLAPTTENLCRDFVEVFKYAVKLTELEFADNWTAQQALYRVPMLRAFGCLRGVKLPADLLDDDLDDGDLPYVDWFYRYAGDGRYQLDDAGENS